MTSTAGYSGWRVRSVFELDSVNVKTHQREIKIFPRVILCHDQDWAVTAGQEEGVTQVSRRSLDTAGR